MHDILTITALTISQKWQFKKFYKHIFTKKIFRFPRELLINYAIRHNYCMFKIISKILTTIKIRCKR
jgi:hypothetical protein